MNSQPPSRSPGLFGRPVLTVTIILAVLAGIGVGGVAVANRGSDPAALWQEPAAAATSGKSVPGTTAAAKPGAAEQAITVSATGDIMMSNAPSRMPPGDGEGFFDSVAADLKSDLVMGNLEQPLTDDTGASKCGTPPEPNCYAFRSPPSYSRHLKAAGFQLMNLANNHTKDFGAKGAVNTRAALDDAGIKYTGNKDEITVVEVKGIKVAVVGFSGYSGANNLNDLDHSREVIQAAEQQADLVIVQVHMGAEGAAMQHVKPGSEIFHGENRGDPIAFSHAVIDAGADLVVGHSPHVLRGMEFYKGKLIAYSLGNFAGGGKTLSNQGVLKYGGILRVTLGKDGSYAAGEFRSTYMNSVGLPTRDKANEMGRQLVSRLSGEDFGDTAARIGKDGSISPRA
ncbi:CapA family protein [Paractinoplanes globisporus]|uniref:CapA family protein n=1 Tax=Paractinoplanes globisporus TaxID=113565 RepID=A0ABW6WRD4_9ACTN|nr:CapA family protein [Actinoplanes globisporus]